MNTWVSVAIVLALIVLEALFVAAEISLVSLREQQVKALAARGRRGARVARLVADPNRFLASVQLGVTLTALLSSAFGAITLAGRAKDALVRAGMAKGPAGVLGFVGVTLVITLVTLVIGELVPKRLALQRAEQAAQLFAPGLDRIATLSRPVIWLLSRATDGLVRLLGGNPQAQRQAISEEELRSLVAAHESLSTDERHLIDEVFAAGERAVREVMVPRTEVAFLDASTTVARAARDCATSPHSRYPVVRGSHDDVVGFVHVRDLLGAGNRGRKVGEVTREVTMLPASKKVLPALSEMRRGGHHLAIVVDEYGGTAGIVTLEDLIEELVGDIRDEYDPTIPDARRLRGGDVEVEGLLNLDEFAETTGVRLPEGPYETAAGFVVNRLGHLPRAGEAVETGQARLTVARLDGRRVDRLRVSLLPRPDPPGT
ncbi:MAG: hemolysin family protein [Mycobacteriales bacterium]